MATLTKLRSSVPGLALIALVFAIDIAIAQSRFTLASPRAISLAVLFDLTVTTTGLAWLLLVRTGIWPARYLRRVASAGLVAAALALPGMGERTKWISFAIDAVVLALIVRRLPAVAASLREPSMGESRLARWERALLAPLGKTGAAIVATEGLVVFYALLGWRAPTPRGDQRFTDHRESQLGMLVGCLLFLTVVEAIPVHLILLGASPVTAWVLLALQFYGAMWLLAEWQSHRLDPIALTQDTLFLNAGLRWRAAIPRSLVQVADSPREDRTGVLVATAFVAANIELVLSEPVTLSGPFGLRRQARVIHLSLDEPERFRAALRG